MTCAFRQRFAPAPDTAQRSRRAAARYTDRSVVRAADGHLRAETTPDVEVPLLVLDVVFSP
jgi:hypothetical protein